MLTILDSKIVEYKIGSDIERSANVEHDIAEGWEPLTKPCVEDGLCDDGEEYAGGWVLHKK